MGAIWVRGAELIGALADLVGARCGLVLDEGNLESIFREHELSEYWPTDMDAMYRYRSETYEDIALTVLAKSGHADAAYVRSSPLLSHALMRDYGNHPEIMTILEFLFTGVSDLPVGNSGKLDPRSLIESATTRWGVAGTTIAISFLKELQAREAADPWADVRRYTGPELLDLKKLFTSEDLPSATGTLFDQRFIDFLHANLDDLGRMHWRQFEGLIGEHLRRLGLHVELGPGRNDDGVDIRAWTGPDGEVDRQLLIVQCKREKNKTEKVVIKALAADIAHEGATAGLVATTSSWSPGARKTVAARGYAISEVNRPLIETWLHGMRTPGSGPWLGE